jgi:hypothetical protein
VPNAGAFVDTSALIGLWFWNWATPEPVPGADSGRQTFLAAPNSGSAWQLSTLGVTAAEWRSRELSSSDNPVHMESLMAHGRRCNIRASVRTSLPGLLCRAGWFVRSCLLRNRACPKKCKRQSPSRQVPTAPLRRPAFSSPTKLHRDAAAVGCDRALLCTSPRRLSLLARKVCRILADWRCLASNCARKSVSGG